MGCFCTDGSKRAICILATLGLVLPLAIGMPHGTAKTNEASSEHTYKNMMLKLSQRDFKYPLNKQQPSVPECIETLQSSVTPVNFMGKPSVFLPNTPDITCDVCSGEVQISGAWSCPLPEGDAHPTILKPDLSEQQLEIKDVNGQNQFQVEFTSPQDTAVVIRTPDAEGVSCLKDLQVKFSDGTGTKTCVQYTVESTVQDMDPYTEDECITHHHKIQQPKCVLLKVVKSGIKSREVFGAALKNEQAEQLQSLDGTCGLDVHGALSCEWMGYINEDEFYNRLLADPVVPSYQGQNMITYEEESALPFTEEPTLVKAYVTDKNNQLSEACAFYLTREPETGELTSTDVAACSKVKFSFGPESQFSASIKFPGNEPDVSAVMVKFLQKNAEDFVLFDINQLLNGPPIPRPVPSV